MDLLNSLGSKAKTDKIRLRIMTESGRLVDEVADVVQTQVIANKARASIRNRDAVPLYHQTEEDRPPVWKENLLIETGLSPQPGMDSRYVLEDGPNLHRGIRSGAVEMGDSKRLNIGMIAIAASVFVLVVCAWLTSMNLAPDVAAPSAVEQEVGTDGELPGLEPVVEGHNQVDELPPPAEPTPSPPAGEGTQ